MTKEPLKFKAKTVNNKIDDEDEITNLLFLYVLDRKLAINNNLLATEHNKTYHLNVFIQISKCHTVFSVLSTSL